MWKPDVARCIDRILAHKKWRSANTWAFEETPLRAGKDAKLRTFLENEVLVAPEGMVDKDGASIVLARLRNNDMSDGRTPKDVCRGVLYVVDRVLERPATQANGLVILHDMTGLEWKHVDREVPALLKDALIGNLPVRIKKIYVHNAPFFFMAFFTVVSALFPSKMKVLFPPPPSPLFCFTLVLHSHAQQHNTQGQD
jgi:hypothetical protein